LFRECAALQIVTEPLPVPTLSLGPPPLSLGGEAVRIAPLTLLCLAFPFQVFILERGIGAKQ
jgi:hypothetical protein